VDEDVHSMHFLYIYNLFFSSGVVVWTVFNILI